MQARRRLVDRCERLGAIEHGEILRRLRALGVPSTQNRNGVFFDITRLSEEVVQDLTRFVEHCLDTQELLRASRAPRLSLRAELGEAAPEAGEADAGAPQERAAAPRARAAEPAPSLGRSTARFHAARKKYSRPVTSRVSYVSDLRRE